MNLFSFIELDPAFEIAVYFTLSSKGYHLAHLVSFAFIMKLHSMFNFHQAKLLSLLNFLFSS